MKKLLLMLLGALFALPAFAANGDEFEYTYEGQTLTYTVLSEADKTVETKKGTFSSAGNSVTGDLILPDKVEHNGAEYTLTSIGNDAFYKCTDLTSVTIPNSVTSIGSNAFSVCSRLKSVTIGKSVTSIGQSAFSGCTALASIEIPNSVTSIGQWAFSKCTGLKSVIIGTSVTSIGVEAFERCTGLIKSAYPNTLSNPFSNGTAISYPAEGAIIEDGFIFGPEKSSIYFAPLDITSVEIPNSVTSIGNYAFYRCSGLTSVEIPNSITTIGSYVFDNCTGLTSIEIPNSVTSIGNYAFYNCYGLKSVTIGKSVTSIGKSAFHYCSGLTSVTIPNSVTSIGTDAFRSCTGLIKSAYPNTLSNPFSNGMAISYPAKGAIIEDGFIFGPEKSAIYFAPHDIKSIEFPNSVTEIGYLAFYNCSGLTSVEIPGSVTYIGINAFYGCTNLKNVYFNATNCTIDCMKDNTIYATFPVTVSNFVFGDKVTKIPEGVLVGNEKIQSIDIPESVTEIGDYAFGWTTALKEIVLPNSVKTIGDQAFYQSMALKTVNLGSSVSNIGESAFDGCTGLTNIEIPNSVTEIGESAFANCTGLTSIEIPNSVTSIGQSAFSNCAGLTSVIIGNSNPSIDNTVTSIGTKVFSNCSDLTNLVINNNVTSSVKGAFSGCNVANVIISSFVKSIGDNVFSNSNIKNVAIGCGIKEIGSQAFGSSFENVYITASEPADAEDNSFANYDADLWLTPGCAIDYKYATDCWWQFSDAKELVVPTDFTTSRTEVTAETGKQVRVGAIFTPEDVTLPYVYWYSTNRDAARVDQNGLITIVDGSLGCDIVAVNLYETYNMAVIKVNGGQPAGEDIVEVATYTTDRPNDIYNMQGVCLKRGASQEDIDALDPGLYIIAGKKVYVK